MSDMKEAREQATAGLRKAILNIMPQIAKKRVCEIVRELSLDWSCMIAAEVFIKSSHHSVALDFLTVETLSELFIKLVNEPKETKEPRNLHDAMVILSEGV
jgi:hypothetical protein